MMNQKSIQDNIIYPFLFSPLAIGRYTIKNRIVALPVHTGFAYPDGQVSSWMIKFYTQLAASGAGMVIVANTAIARDGIVSRFNLRADKDEFIPGLARLAESIKQKGAIACLQLNHAGRFAKAEHRLLPSPITSSNLSFNVESLKRFMDFFPFEKRFNLTHYFISLLKTWRTEMTEQDRERIIDDFVSSAFRAYQAGFDMVELHGANGYLLCQYLSSFTNKIKSGYGPDFKARIRFPLQVIKAIKNRMPNNFPLGFRLLLKEWVPGGIDLPEALDFARILEKEGISYLSGSVGTYNSIFSPDAIKIMAKPSYLEDDMATLTKAVGIPAIASGRIASPVLANNMIRTGKADLIGLGRPLRTDPKWLEKARKNSKNILTCVNCNWCLKRVVLEQGFNCRRWPEILRERTHLEHQLLTRNYKTLWVISDIKDIQTFKYGWPLLDPGYKKHLYPRILILKGFMENRNFDTALKDFLHWIKFKIDPLSLTGIPFNYTIREDKQNWETVLLNEISKQGYGKICVASSHDEIWRERLIYKQRGKVMVKLGIHSHLYHVMVPVDFSPATLLVMKYLHQTLLQNDRFKFDFIHIVPDPADSTRVRSEWQWKKFKKIAKFDERIPLQVISSKSDVPATLVKMIETQKYGIVIMGKRGLAGIKRWLLGSVTTGVLRSLNHQTIILID